MQRMTGDIVMNFVYFDYQKTPNAKNSPILVNSSALWNAFVDLEEELRVSPVHCL